MICLLLGCIAMIPIIYWGAKVSDEVDDHNEKAMDDYVKKLNIETERKRINNSE